MSSEYDPTDELGPVESEIDTAQLIPIFEAILNVTPPPEDTSVITMTCHAVLSGSMLLHTSVRYRVDGFNFSEASPDHIADELERIGDRLSMDSLPAAVAAYIEVVKLRRSDPVWGLNERLDDALQSYRAVVFELLGGTITVPYETGETDD